MKRRMKRLWDELELPGAAFEADRRGVLERVNGALNAEPSGRRGYARVQIRRAVLITAAALLLTGTTLAAVSNWDVLGAFFTGDTTSVQDQVRTPDLSVGNDQFTITAEGYINDYQISFMVLTITGHTEEAKALLFQEDFRYTDHADYEVEVQEEDGEVYPGGNGGYGYSCKELEELRTDRSRSYRLMLDLDSRATRAWLSFDFLPEDLVLEFPLDRPVESLSLEMDFQGTDRDGGGYRLSEITVSPLTVQIRYHALEGEDNLNLHYFFLMSDGRVRAFNDMILNGYSFGDGYSFTTTLIFRQVQQGSIRAILLDGTAFPLDGGAPYTVEVAPKLYPFTMDLLGGVELTDELYGPFYLLAEELCEKLGADCRWEEEAQRATLTYRGVTLELTAD